MVEFLREPLRSQVQHVRVEYRPSPAAAGGGGGSLLTVPHQPLVRRRSGDVASERRRTLSRLEEEVEELGGRLRLAGRPAGEQPAHNNRSHR